MPVGPPEAGLVLWLGAGLGEPGRLLPARVLVHGGAPGDQQVMGAAHPAGGPTWDAIEVTGVTDRLHERRSPGWWADLGRGRGHRGHRQVTWAPLTRLVGRPGTR